MKRLIALFTALLMLLSGCSIKERQEDLILKLSGITADEEYNLYEERKEAGLLDENGLYDEQLQWAGYATVTFARNPYLELDYFLDEELTEPIDPEGCHLKPGEKIYASEAKSTYPSDKYSFQGFLVYAFQENGVPLHRSGDEPAIGRKNLVYEITEEDVDTYLSVFPCGRFNDRTLELHDHVVGEEDELRGEWWIEGDPDHKTKRESLSVSPYASYTVYYSFSDYKDDYYFYRAEPATDNCYEAEVIFDEESALNGSERFDVWLHPYLELKIDGDTSLIKEISVDEEQRDPKALKKNTLTKLKCGDDIDLTVKSGSYVYVLGPDVTCVQMSSAAREYRITLAEDAGGGQENKIVITEKKPLSYEPRELEHGVLEVGDKYGTPLQPGAVIGQEEKVTVSIKPDEGYYIQGLKDKDGGEYEETMTYSGYCATIENILSRHPIKPYITVTLETIGQHGTCEYFLGDDPVVSPAKLQEGQTITEKYTLSENSGYTIPRPRLESLWAWASRNKNSIEVEIPITESLDGTTILPEDNVTLKREGAEKNEAEE